MDDLVYRLTMRAADDDCTAAAARIASLTEAVRVLTEALENMVKWHANRGGPGDNILPPELQEPEVFDAMAALTTAKELTK